MKTPQPTRQSASATGRPATWTLVRWITLVLAVHLGVLMGIAGTLDWHLQSPPVIRTGPMQTRWVAPPVAPSPARSTVIAKASTAKTRVAQVNQAALSTNPTAPLPKLEEAMPKDVPEATLPPAQVSALDATQAAFAPQAQASAPAMVAMPDTVDAHASSPAASGPPLAQSNAPEPVPAASLNHLATPTAPAASAETSTTATKPPDVIATATMDLPNVALASLPPSTVVSYRLNGQEKGLNYQASGELRWQHNDTAYAMSLSVKAFLVGSRYWRSQGQITSAGLVPAKFSDSWRSERAAHFDHAQNRIVFSNNAPTAPLQPGAQDQISLYVQLAAAMAGSGSGLKQGTRLQIQTATIRDALPWLLTLEQIDTLTIDGQAVQATKWVCQPRNRFDAKVEFWVTAEHHWLPVRIRITQVNGSFIDLNLNAREPLPPLPAPQLPS